MLLYTNRHRGVPVEGMRLNRRGMHRRLNVLGGVDRNGGWSLFLQFLISGFDKRLNVFPSI